MHKLKVAVVGVGHLGKFHARVLSEMEDVELVGVVDIDAKIAGETAAKYNTTPYSSHNEIIDKVDAVSIAVPTNLHYEIGRDFLARGIPAMIEKPITEDAATARKLVDIAREKNTILQVGHIERFNPAIVATREIIDTPRFIESHRLAPYSFRSRDVDVVMDLMIHDIDIILNLVNSPLKEVRAVGHPVISKSEDIANARLTFESGCVANITASRLSLEAARKVRVFCDHCYVSLDYGKRTAQLFRPCESIRNGTFDIEDFLGKTDLSNVKDLRDIVFKDFVAVEEVPMNQADQLESELGAFVECVREGRRPLVSGEDGLLALEVAERIIEAIRSHKWAD